jgi:hypothetical protein
MLHAGGFTQVIVIKVLFIFTKKALPPQSLHIIMATAVRASPAMQALAD